MPFPLTLILSPRERKQRASRNGEPERSGLFSARRMGHPLPKGEGRLPAASAAAQAGGEGKQTTARRSANVLDLSCGRCPQGSGIDPFTISSLRAMPEVSDFSKKSSALMAA